MEQRKITFIGAGNMAQAIIAGLLRAGYPAPLI
ncbi:MAG: NAD(P)-binding domain-containing protein, partial [Plesiomonas shigelloides]